MEKGRDHLALKSIAAGGQYAQNCTTSTAEVEEARAGSGIAAVHRRRCSGTERRRRMVRAGRSSRGGCRSRCQVIVVTRSWLLLRRHIHESPLLMELEVEVSSATVQH
uniref:Uncharacterized protein n=1 Tax=Oryza meridionalis TaxID=40149 RepID=A0A0E0EXF1_9ORYZ